MVERRSNGSSLPRWSAAVALFAVVLVAYLPVIRTGGYVWDDDDYIVENETLRDLHGLYRIWFDILPAPGDYPLPQYYPAVHTLFWTQYQLWGLEPMGFHLVNVLLHGLNALLLWRVLRRLELPGAWVAAAVFGLHPVHVESVAWVAELKNVLSGTFYLGAMLAYLSFDPLPADGTRGPRRWGMYGLALFLFLWALLSKTITASLPVVLLLLAWWKRGSLGRREILPTLPMFAIGVPMAWLTAWMEKHVVGAIGEDWAFSWIERLLIAGRASWFYATKILWPHPIIYIYPKWPIHSAWSWALTLAAVAVPVALWLSRGRLGRGPLVAVAAFGVSVAPALGFIPHFLMRYFFVADHFQYLASIGVIALAVGSAATLVKRIPALRPVAIGAAVLVVAVLGMLTWKQGHAYDDEATLWRDTLTKNPESWVAHHNLGQILLVERRYAEAAEHLEQALRIDPGLAEAHNNLGLAAERLGRTAEARSHYLEALRLDPRLADAHINLGIQLARMDRMDDAVEHFIEAASLRPDLAGPVYNLGLVRLHQGRLAEALAALREALARDPQDPEIRLQLGFALAAAGDREAARREMSEALRLRPGWDDAERALARIPSE